MSGVAERLARAWRHAPPEHRVAAVASGALLVTMFLPWYQLTVRTRSGLGSTKLSAFGDFSWVEGAILLVALGVLVLLFARAERKAFHLPGGDGTVILIAGAWATVLLAYRAFDKPGDPKLSAVGLEWGFVFAFAAAGALAYTGIRLRAAHRPEPPLPPRLRDDPPTAPTRPSPPTRPTEPFEPSTQGTEPFEPLPETEPVEPTTRIPNPVGAHRAPRPAPDHERLDDLTAAHGSEEPLPRADLTEELPPRPGRRR